MVSVVRTFIVSASVEAVIAHLKDFSHTQQ